MTIYKQATNLMNGARHWQSLLSAKSPSDQERARLRWRLWCGAQTDETGAMMYRHPTVAAAMELRDRAFALALNLND